MHKYVASIVDSIGNGMGQYNVEVCTQETLMLLSSENGPSQTQKLQKTLRGKIYFGVLPSMTVKINSRWLQPSRREGLCLEIASELLKLKKCPWKFPLRSSEIPKYLQKAICLEAVHLW